MRETLGTECTYMARLRRPVRPVLWLLLGGALLAAQPALAQQAYKDFAITVYLQQAFPKQTNTNKQIEQINDQFGTDFDTWDDIANLSLGVKFFTQVSPYWQVGIEWDYSRGGIDGSATVPTEAGPAQLEFSQHYSIYTDLMAAAHFLPCPTCRKVVPFVLLGGGFGYERDTTELTLRNDVVDQWLKVDNDGWFPVWTAGLGANIDLSRSGGVYLEVGVAYYWGRLDHMVEAEGPLAPAPEVRADNDTTGPNYWLGVGWRF
jgi:hypothetical protein